MNTISPLAFIHPNAKIGDNNIIGPFCYIDDNTVIGDNNKLLNSVTIHTGARIGNGNEFFPPTSLQIANIHAGTGSNNVIPGELYVQFNLRYCTEVADESIKQKVAEMLAKHGLKYRIDWNLSGKPFLTKPGKLLDALTTAIEQTTGVTPQAETGGGTSDGRFIALMGAEVVEFGPLNATIHKVNECVNVDDLAKCSQIYHQMLVNLLDK